MTRCWDAGCQNCHRFPVTIVCLACCARSFFRSTLPVNEVFDFWCWFSSTNLFVVPSWCKRCCIWMTRSVGDKVTIEAVPLLSTQTLHSWKTAARVLSGSSNNFIVKQSLGRHIIAVPCSSYRTLSAQVVFPKPTCSVWFNSRNQAFGILRKNFATRILTSRK